jgi:hypothetical protein
MILTMLPRRLWLLLRNTTPPPLPATSHLCVLCSNEDVLIHSNTKATSA